MRFLTIALACASLTTTNAWSTGNLNRQQMFGVMGAAGVAAVTQEANAATAKTGASSPFTGFYDDPNHPECLRQVKVVGAKLRGDGTRSAYPVIEVTGYDGNGSGAMCSDRPTVSF